MDKIYQRLVSIAACTPFHHFGFAMLVFNVLFLSAEKNTRELLQCCAGNDEKESDETVFPAC